MSKSIGKILSQALPSFDTGSQWLNMLFSPAANIKNYGKDMVETAEKQEAAQEELMTAASNRKTPKQIDDESDVARRDFYQKQALLAMRKGTTKTGSLGVASDVLQTNRKSLLGAT